MPLLPPPHAGLHTPASPRSLIFSFSRFKTTDFNEYQTATDLILCTFVCCFNVALLEASRKVNFRDLLRQGLHLEGLISGHIYLMLTQICV
ncbi:hypothetical protein ACB092_08G015400 [Castanea dentata]